MSRKPFYIIIGLVIWGLLLFSLFVLSTHPRTQRLREFIGDNITDAWSNFTSSVSVSRRPPLSTLELEEYLKRNLAVPFASFRQDDWRWFWHLLYGTYTVDSRGWIKRKRQLTKEEIQSSLVEYYYRPFGSFGEREWGIFWQHILKGKVFK